jgi:hypothetical protein
MSGRRQARPTSVITINTAEGAVAENHSYQLRTPVLIIRFGTTQVQIATAQADRVTAAEVEFALQLAREANDFARSVERSFRGRRSA